jgi:hypothetical protein
MDVKEKLEALYTDLDGFTPSAGKTSIIGSAFSFNVPCLQHSTERIAIAADDDMSESDKLK